MSKHCYKCNYDYTDFSVRECPHPAVQLHYGRTICVYCCKKCKFAIRSDLMFDGLKCGYENNAKEKEERKD